MPPASWLYWAVFLAHASPSLAWVAPSQYATARHPQGLDPRRAAVVTAASLWAFTVQVAPVKNDAEIREAAAFFADAFFNVRSQDGSIQPEALAKLEADQYADWLQRYGSKQPLFKDQQCLLVARDFGRIVGTASVAARPYSGLGRDGRPRSARSAEEMAASKRDAAALVPLVANVAVVANARRRGIAEKMCIQCERIAKGWGYKEISLAVDSNNVAAKKLYQKKLRYSVLWDEISSTKIVAGGSKVRTVPTTTTALVKQIR